MAKTGGAVKKLQDKSQRNRNKFRMGTFKPLLVRTKSPFGEKVVTFKEHQRAIHGLSVFRGEREIVVDYGGRNPVAAETFKGDGLPDDSLAGVQPPKTTAERAAADKRNSIKSETHEGFRPRPFGKRARSGCYLAK